MLHRKAYCLKAQLLVLSKRRNGKTKFVAVSFGVNPGSGPLKMGQQTTGNGPTQTSDTKL